MKLSDLIREEDEKSDYVLQAQNELVDYLTSLVATNIKMPLRVEKVATFMKSQGYNVTPAQISDMLEDSSFTVSGGNIDINQGDSDKEIDSDVEVARAKHQGKQKVNNMARNQINQGLQ